MFSVLLDTLVASHALRFLKQYERQVDSLAKMARARGRVGGGPRRLSEKQETMIWRLRQEGESVREIGRMFNVSTGTIRRALARREQATGEN